MHCLLGPGYSLASLGIESSAFAAQAGTPVQGEPGSQSVQCARPVAARLVRRPPWLMPDWACCLPKLPCLPSRHKSRHHLMIDKTQHEQALQGCVYARGQPSILWAALMLTSQQSSPYLTVLLDKRLLAKALMRPARRVSLIDICLCRDLRHRHEQAACQPFTMGRQECKFITHRQGE